MAIDTPARIAIIGAGPIGLEAALYARFLGYDVDILERGQVADAARLWAHFPLLGTVAQMHSPLGVAALQAQDANYSLPVESDLLTCQDWLDAYVLPLAASDLLSEQIRERTEVLWVGRTWEQRREAAVGDSRRDDVFRILVRDAQGRESVLEAAAILDASGCGGEPLGLGFGGIPALGEAMCEARIERAPPRFPAEASRFVGVRTLLVGDTVEAAFTALQLAEIARNAPGTACIWLTRGAELGQSAGPVPTWAGDPCVRRAALVAQANRLAIGASPGFALRVAPALHSIEWDAALSGFVARIDGDETGERFDRIVALVGRRPDYSFARELQLQPALCSESTIGSELTPGPAAQPCDSTNSAAASSDSIEPAARTSEPDYYVLGAKSYGRQPYFCYAQGLDQIRSLFARIGDRPTLDLYSREPPKWA